MMPSAFLIAGSVVLLVALLWIVKRAAWLFGLKPELQRKTVHVGLGLYCLCFPWIFGAAWQVALTCAIATLLLVALRTGAEREKGLGSALHAVGRQSYGEILFALSVAMLFYFKGKENVLYLLPIAILTLADASAALIGARYGWKTFRIERGEKSVEGVAVFLLVALIVSMGVLLHFSSVPRENVLLLSLAVAAIGAAIEAESWRGWDNLFVPLGIYVFLARYLNAPITEVMLAVAMLLTALFVVFQVLPKASVDRHASLAATLVLFVIWVEAGRVNVVAPLAAIVAHFALARREPEAGDYPRHSALAGVVVIALAWYGINKLTGYNTAFLFNLSFAVFGAFAAALAIGCNMKWLVPAVLALWIAATARVWIGSHLDPLKVIYLALSLGITGLAAWAAQHFAFSLGQRRFRKLVPAAIALSALAFPVAFP